MVVIENKWYCLSTKDMIKIERTGIVFHVASVKFIIINMMSVVNWDKATGKQVLQCATYNI